MATSLENNSERVSPSPHEETPAALSIHKTELIGELAHAMANQMNNIMMAITGYADLELKKANDKQRRSLEQVLAHTTRATFLIQKLLDFSSTRQSLAQRIDIHKALPEIEDLLRDLLGDEADLSFGYGAQPAIVQVDRVDLEQTLFTLMVILRNTVRGKSKVAISTSLRDLDQEFIGTDSAEPGKYAVLSLESFGDASKADRLLSDQNQIITLSIAAVRKIVKTCHGLVRFSNEPGATRFRLFFPLWIEENTEDGVDRQSQNRSLSNTVLVVEDDDAVRVPAAEFLMMEGFKVLQARNGAEALKAVERSRSPVDVLVTDIFMPKMNGHEVAAALIEQHPNMKVLYMSGDPGRSSLSAAHASELKAALRKPFRLNTLRDRIRDLLTD